jgi:hypothetical protein
MSITQTVDVPDSRRLTIEVPREIPKGDYWMADDFDAPLEDFKDYIKEQLV